MQRTGHRTDLVIVGGGLIGLAVAWEAARRGIEVTVYEAGTARAPQPGSAWWAAAGMLAPVSEADPGEPGLLALGVDAATAWPAFAAALQRVTGDDAGYRRCGTLLVARNADEAAALTREQHLREQMGVAVARLTPSAARDRVPALAPTVRLALHAPDDHAADPRRLHAALRAAALAAGVTISDDAPVAEVVTEGPARCTGVRLADGATARAARVLLAAGAWAGAIAGLPGRVFFPIRPVKGQVLRLRDPDGPGLLEAVLRFEGGYLVPRGDGQYVLGATMEERGFDTTVTVGGAYELLRDATELVPGLDELVIEETVVGLRPGSPDNTPLVGSTAVEGLFVAGGHYRNGVLLSSRIGAMVVDALLGLSAPPAACDPARFAPTTPAGVVA